MRTHHDAKAMAKTLREELQARNHAITHGECLDIVAKQFGLKDWNVLAAKMGDAPSAPTSLQLPENWIVSGSAPLFYEMGAEPGQSGTAVIRRIKEITLSAGGQFGTLMQAISAADFLGQHIAFSGELKTTDVVGSATIWLRIDDRQNKLLQFNNLEKQTTHGSLSGTNEWSQRRIVLPVPPDAGSINFGFYLSGSGAVWGRNFSLSVTDEPAPDHLASLPRTPQNLAFNTA
jgi:hypothetical protein